MTHDDVITIHTHFSISPLKHQKLSTSSSKVTKIGTSRSFIPCTYPNKGKRERKVLKYIFFRKNCTFWVFLSSFAYRDQSWRRRTSAGYREGPMMTSSFVINTKKLFFLLRPNADSSYRLRSSKTVDPFEQHLFLRKRICWGEEVWWRHHSS